jgi:hypothetical protein
MSNVPNSSRSVGPIACTEAVAWFYEIASPDIELHRFLRARALLCRLFRASRVSRRPRALCRLAPSPRAGRVASRGKVDL